MNVILNATYPSQIVKAVTDVFLSPDMPKRPETAKELDSITYIDQDAVHAIFIFSVPDPDLASFYEAQAMRNFFMASRVEGYQAAVHAGLSVAEAVPKLMPVLPG